MLMNLPTSLKLSLSQSLRPVDLSCNRGQLDGSKDNVHDKKMWMEMLTNLPPSLKLSLTHNLRLRSVE